MKTKLWNFFYIIRWCICYYSFSKVYMHTNWLKVYKLVWVYYELCEIPITYQMKYRQSHRQQQQESQIVDEDDKYSYSTIYAIIVVFSVRKSNESLHCHHSYQPLYSALLWLCVTTIMMDHACCCRLCSTYLLNLRFVSYLILAYLTCYYIIHVCQTKY